MEHQRKSSGAGVASSVPTTALMQSSSSSNELIYGGTNSATGSEEASSHVMSDKVQMIASAIYKEFESMIQKFGQNSVKDMMPLVVSVLENLDSAYIDKDELVVDLEMLKEENEQLLNQYERERQTRKNQDQKCLEVEETLLEQNRELEAKVDSMASIVRMLELKAKNASDHANRLEEREADQKMEYEKLHERYNELLRTHIDHVERTKFLMGAEMFDMAQSLPVNAKNDKNLMAMSAIDTNVRGISDLISAVHMSQSTHADMNLANHISSERDWHEEFGEQQTAAEILSTPRPQPKSSAPLSAEQVEKLPVGQEEEATDKMVNEDGDALSLGADLTGMGREVENLIRENTELMETKNALNIVKNDLIARVDQLSSEQQVFREEVRSLELVKLKLSERIRELENELKELKEKKNQEEENAEEDVAGRKRFTRVEMARVLMERNQYKESLFELQEAVKFTELQRARKSTTSSQNNKSIWSFFSNLLGDSSSTASSARRQSHHHPARKPPTGVRSRSQIPASPLTQRKARNYDSDVDMKQEKLLVERRKHYRAVSQHMNDFPNAYGWSLPPTNAQNLSVPVPVNCRPLSEDMPSLKVCCAASCSLYGGLINDEDNQQYIVGDPILGCDPYLLLQNSRGERSKTIGDMKKLNGGQFFLLESSSLVWICSTNERKKPFITILDVNNPSHLLERFSIDDIGARLLCIGSVPGAHESDIRITDEGLSPTSELCSPGGYLEKDKLEPGSDEIAKFGSVQFVSLQKSTANNNTPTYVSDMYGQRKSPARRRREYDDEASISQNKTPSPLDKLPLHIRNTLKRYENVDDNNILALPLMWIGLENEYICVYSAVKEWRKCLLRIAMPDAVLSILHTNGRVFVALANGCVAVFHRDMSGKWSDKGYHLMQLGAADASVCHLCEVNGKIWAAYRNCVVVLDPVTLRINHTFVAHPRKDSRVRQLVHYGNGVWTSIRLDSTIRLFNAETYQHLQDIDVGSFIAKMLGPNKLDLVLLRITSLSIMDRRVWIGTGSGIVVSMPFTDENAASSTDENDRGAKGPGKVVRLMDSAGASNDSNSVIPFCEISQARLSFHGHKDPVRFLIPVLAEGFSDLTQNSNATKIYMVSGGDGYIDFRLGEEESDEQAKSVRIGDMSHLLIWENECPFDWQGEK